MDRSYEKLELVESLILKQFLVVYTFAIGSIINTPEAVYNISFKIHTLKLITD